MNPKALLTAAVSVAIYTTSGWSWAIQPTPLWQPKQPSPECNTVTVHLISMDTSGSMRPIIGPALKQCARYVEEVQNQCLYVINAQFGTTASIVTDGYLTTNGEKARLVSEIIKPPKLQHHTNMDAAAALVEIVVSKLERSLKDRNWSMTASVITDGRPEPSEGNEPFDLSQWYNKVVRGVKPNLHLKLLRVGRSSASGSIPVESLSAALRAAVPVELPAAVSPPAPVEATKAEPPAPPSPPAPQPPSPVEKAAPPTPKSVSAQRLPDPGATRGTAGPDAHSRSIPDATWIAAVIAAVGLLVALFGLLGRRGVGSADGQAALPPKKVGAPGGPGIPVALDVTERELSKDGQAGRVLQKRKVPIAAETPVTFGDNTCTYPVMPLDDGLKGEIFRVSLLADGRFYLHPGPNVNVFCNEAMPGKGGLIVPADHQKFHVRAGRRRWSIRPLSEMVKTSTTHSLFKRIRENRGAATAHPVNS